MTDELDRIRELRPSVSPPPRELVETERTRLMAIVGEAPQESRGLGRRSKRWLVPAAALVVLATAAAGYAFTRDVGTTTEVSCPDGIVDAVTGDPVADCADLWRQQKGTEPPPLIAYDNQRGGIEVVPVDTSVPLDWRPLGGGVAQDPRLIELDAALADHGDGLNAQCYLPGPAVPLAEATLQRLGLADWSVHVDRDRKGGDGTCAAHVLDPGERTVILFGLETEPPPADAPYVRLARAVQDQVDDECLARGRAVDVVRRIATDLGIDETAGEVVIHSVPDDSAVCSRTDVNVGGRIEVTVRGA